MWKQRILEVAVASSLLTGWALTAPGSTGPIQPVRAELEQRLAVEVRHQGWIAFAARSEQGDWDLFLGRPDGSDVRNLTRTPELNEAAPQFSRDDRELLYRRLPRNETIEGNRYGEQGELVFAHIDGTAPQAFGKPGEYPWASWSPDGQQIACLSLKGIAFVDLATRKVVRAFDRQGFFQQLTWSPDGQWLVGVANAYGTGWSIARLSVATGEAQAVNRVDCCTPDWFPDSRNVIFSWRPPGQKGNGGQGWTQLWMADAQGKSRRLIYGEDGRHVYGGHVSPDGQYVLFTGNMQEDGDPGRSGAPMALMRLKDAPIIGGESQELRALHPDAHNGPVLVLPVGWEPCWTFSETPGQPGRAAPEPPQVGATTPEVNAAAARSNPHSPGSEERRAAVDDVAGLARELHGQGWLVYSAKTDQGDWDLFLMRADGSDRRQLTRTAGFNEAGARFSPDGRKLLYYRMARTEALDNNTYGTFDLVIADADGGHPLVYGNQFPWAAWGPDGTQLACLTPKGIELIDLASRKIVRQLPRKGIVQQLTWSPDGRWFVGTANGLGPFWCIGRLSLDTGELNAVSEVDRYNCTPDWVPDSRQIVYARGIIPDAGGRAELWVASGDGREKRMLYAEESRHIYGACASPDAKFLLFTRSVEDLGKVDNSRTTMSIIRWSDTPMIGEPGASLRTRFPQAKRGPRLDLGQGWEPHWTYTGVVNPGKGASR